MRVAKYNRKRVRRLWLGGSGMVAACIWFLSACETGNVKTFTAADIIRADKAHEAAIRAEANAPGPAPADEKRIAGVISARADRENQELAAYARFQFQQKLDLAEASAPRIYMGPQGAADELGQTGSVQNAPRIAFGGHALRHGGRAVGSDSPGASDRFFVRQTIENSTDQMVQDAAQRESDQGNANNGGNNSTPPFGVPVPGKSGYITSPQQSAAGYIDVHGYQSGSTVIDPYTGNPIRVP